LLGLRALLFLFFFADFFSVVFPVVALFFPFFFLIEDVHDRTTLP
jgi:hypothetical protein